MLLSLGRLGGAEEDCLLREVEVSSIREKSLWEVERPSEGLGRFDRERDMLMKVMNWIRIAMKVFCSSVWLDEMFEPM